MISRIMEEQTSGRYHSYIVGKKNARIRGKERKGTAEVAYLATRALKSFRGIIGGMSSVETPTC